jgi:hypothetical protein
MPKIDSKLIKQYLGILGAVIAALLGIQKLYVSMHPNEDVTKVIDLTGQLYDGNVVKREQALNELAEYAPNKKYHERILAALEDEPGQHRSDSEMKLTFRLLNKIGPDATGLLAEWNRKYRSAFDKDSRQLFWSNFSADPVLFANQGSRTDQTNSSNSADEYTVEYNQLWQIMNEEAAELKIPRSYLVATLMAEDKVYTNSLSATFVRDSRRRSLQSVRDELQQFAGVDISSLRKELQVERQVISWSENELESLLINSNRSLHTMDLTSCFLGDVKWNQVSYRNLVLDQAYLGEVTDLSLETLTSFNNSGLVTPDDNGAAQIHMERLNVKFLKTSEAASILRSH